MVDIQKRCFLGAHVNLVVVANVNGFTQPSLNDLHRLIVSHGGGFMQYLDGKTTVTHIIASSLTPKKVEEFRRYRIVKPAWVVDSISAGRLLPWDGYRVVDEGTAQKVLGFDNGQVVSRVNDKARGYRDQTDASWYTSQLAKSSIQPDTQLPTPRESSPFETIQDQEGMDTDEIGQNGIALGPSTESFSFDVDIEDLISAEQEVVDEGQPTEDDVADDQEAVSYTHLTLPTKRIV